MMPLEHHTFALFDFPFLSCYANFPSSAPTQKTKEIKNLGFGLPCFHTLLGILILKWETNSTVGSLWELNEIIYVKHLAQWLQCSNYSINGINHDKFLLLSHLEYLGYGETMLIIQIINHWTIITSVLPCTFPLCFCVLCSSALYLSDLPKHNFKCYSYRGYARSTHSLPPRSRVVQCEFLHPQCLH